MRKSIYILIFGWLFVTTAIRAQQVVSITKAEVLNKVSENNFSIKISEEEFNKAKADYSQTNAVFLPNISVSYTGITTTNPLMAFGSKLNQEVLTQNDFNPALLNDPSQIQNFATKFEIQQPLLNLDGHYQRKAAKTKMQSISLQTERTRDYLIFEVEKAYMQLQLAYKALTVFEKSLEAANANLALANNRFKQGYLQRVDVLVVEVRVTDIKNQLQNAKSNVRNASNYISFLMNESLDAIYEPSDSLTISTINVEKNTVSENRADIKAMQLASDAFKTMHKADKVSFLPRLNAFGSYELYDDKIFQADANGYLVGAQLQWNLLEGTKRFGKTKKSKAAYDKATLEYEQYVSQSQLEFNKTKRLLLDAENKLALASLALEQSKESFRIRTNRFKEGLEKTSDLLLAETQYAQKQLEYYQTIFEYNFAQVYLTYLTKE